MVIELIANLQNGQIGTVTLVWKGRACVIATSYNSRKITGLAAQLIVSLKRAVVTTKSRQSIAKLVIGMNGWNVPKLVEEASAFGIVRSTRTRQAAAKHAKPHCKSCKAATNHAVRKQLFNRGHVR
jgi:hypothetical protein